MKRLVIVVLALGLLAGLLWLAFFRRSSEQNEARSARELATRALAEHLVTKSGTKRVLVIANPFAHAGQLPRGMRDMEAAGLRGLQSGGGAQLQLQIAWPELKAGVAENPRSVFIDPETTTPLSYLVAADGFDKLAQQHPDCDLIVSLIGLPADLAHVQCWQNPAEPKFALLLPDLRVIGNRAAVRHSLEAGKLVAFVAARPDALKLSPNGAGDWRTQFEQLFVLVTRENVEALMQKFPQLFPAN